MTKISNTGGGSPGPIRSPEPNEPIKDSSGAKETQQVDSQSSSTPSKEITGDKYAAGELITKGERVKSQLNSELQNQTEIQNKTKNQGVEDKELAQQVAKGQQRFAPPYVPVGPVVTGDNIGVPAQPPAEKEKELADQAAKGQQRFAPPYVPVGPVVMGDNIATPGHVNATETRQMNLRSDQFQINDQGNLVITNEKLIEYFKSLKESGQEILLGITPKKPGTE